MKERGLILPIGDGCEIMLLHYWRCWLGHDWVYGDRDQERVCSKCNKRMLLQLTNSGMTKSWCWWRPKEAVA